MQKILTLRDTQGVGMAQFVRIYQLQYSTLLTLPKGTAAGPALKARVNQGRWIVDCPFPFCTNAQIVDDQEPWFYCLDVGCNSADNGHLTLPVRFPHNRRAIEAALLERPHPDFMNWEPGVKLTELKALGSFHESWTAPKTYAVGDILTAADMNTYQRDNLLETAPAKAAAKGDSFWGTAANAIAKLAAGTDGQHLEFDSAQAAGIKAVAKPTGGLSFEGSNTTEATTTSTTEVDVLTVSGLNVAAATPFIVFGSARKTTGAASDAYLGLKLNTTVVIDTTVGTQSLLKFGSFNAAASGAFYLYVGPRVTNYLRGLLRWGSVDIAGGGADLQSNLTIPNDMPTAAITDVIIRGVVLNGAMTLGIDEVFVYTLATS